MDHKKERRNECQHSGKGGERDVATTHPTVFEGLFPTLAVLANADNDVQAIIAGVEALSVALRAITNEGKRIVFEVAL